MNIVVLDGHALNPGDLDWGPLEKLGTLTVYERSEAGQVTARARDADVVLANKSLLLKEQLSDLPNLKFISVMATGYNIVDVQTAKERGIQVSNVVCHGRRTRYQHKLQQSTALPTL